MSSRPFMTAGPRRSGTWIFALVLVVGLSFTPCSVAAELKIGGSDWLGADFEAALRAFSNKENQPVSASFQGSRPGLDALRAGKVDLAIVALAPDEKIGEGELVVSTWAYRIAVVAVPRSIGLTQISFTQLDGFFGASGPAGFTHWRDVGVTGRAAQLTVGTHVLAGDTDAVSVDIFRHLALRVPRIKSSVMRHQLVETLKDKLAAEEGGLAILPEDPADAELRVLAVARADGEPAYTPSRENIHTGDYPLRTPLFLVYRHESAPALQRLLVFLWSEDAARSVMQGSHCVPVPASARPALR